MYKRRKFSSHQFIFVPLQTELCQHILTDVCMEMQTWRIRSYEEIIDKGSNTFNVFKAGIHDSIKRIPNQSDCTVMGDKPE